MPRKRSVLLGVAVTAALVAVGGGAYGQPPMAGQGPVVGVTAASAPSTTAQVTLITGDVVMVDTQNGRSAISVTRPDGTPTSKYHSYSVDKDVYVIPFDAQPLLASGQLDQQLFNVTGLIAQGYDDAHSTSIPLIARYARGKAAAPTAPAGSRVKFGLPSIRGAALGADKKQAATFWEAVDDDSPRGHTPKARLAGGLDRLWLDGKAQATLDQSVPQIGAPEAWAAGFDGTGVKVAILDTGVDLNFPDLAGKIVESRSFVPGESVQDGNGHGTHVASTIAGSGAASGGKYKGVAPGARLLIGKVLSNSGSGYYSGIINGMDWAAHSGAKVVSMSLGGDAGDGIDPMAEAVNQLTAETGALFTIAAGNSGSKGASTIGSPGIAAAALTVGAVDRADAVTYFSSRGPVKDGSLKPEITAPGWKIVAARAAGTSMGAPVDDYYTAASGTSMATPHVAGAVAILAQEHPDWTAARLKSQLVSTAKPTPDSSVYAQGAGRTDVSRAVRQTVSGPGVLDFGLQLWGSTGPVEKQIAYRNDGDQPVTLALTTTGSAAQLPAGVLALSADTVIVPAHGTAGVAVTLTSGTLTPGGYGAHVAATSGDGGTVVSTAVGFVKETEHFNVTVKLRDFDDKAPPSTVSTLYVFDLTHPRMAMDYYELGGDVTWNLRLPRGEYAFQAWTERMTPDWEQTRDYTYGAKSGVFLDSDRTITFDGRQSTLVTMQTPKPSQTQRVRLGTSLFRGDKSKWYGFGTSVPGYTKLRAIPVQDENLENRLEWSLIAPELEAQVVSPGAFPIAPEYVAGWNGSARIDGTQLVRVVNAGIGRPQDYAGKAVKGKLAVVRRSDAITTEQQFANAAAAGAAMILVYNDLADDWGANHGGLTATVIPAMTLSGEQGSRLAALADAGEVTIQFKGTAVSPYCYELLKYQTGISADQHYQVSANELATVDTSFHASTPGTLAGYVRMITTPSQIVYVRDWVRTTMPRSLTEYVTAGSPTWESTFIWADPINSLEERVPSVLQPLQHVTNSWNKPVVRSGLPSKMPGGAVRVGDTATYYTTGLLAEAANQYTSTPGSSDKSFTSVYVNGQLLGSAPAAAVFFPMLPERAQYRVVTGARRDAPWWTTSTKVNTAWTFYSEHTGAKESPLPYLSVDYNLDVALNNTVRAQSSAAIGLNFRYPNDLAGLRIREAKLWASYDDGATWQEVSISTAGDTGFTGNIKSPALRATNGFVSLRVKATDVDGNSVEQTVTRAYKLQG